jgi:hypothetical protein
MIYPHGHQAVEAARSFLKLLSMNLRTVPWGQRDTLDRRLGLRLADLDRRQVEKGVARSSAADSVLVKPGAQDGR